MKEGGRGTVRKKNRGGKSCTKREREREIIDRQSDMERQKGRLESKGKFKE